VNAALTSRADRIIARCLELARCTEVPGETTRTFLAPSMHRVHAMIADGCGPRACPVTSMPRQSARVLRPQTRAPRLLIGSHLDTVVDSGAFDASLEW